MKSTDTDLSSWIIDQKNASLVIERNVRSIKLQGLIKQRIVIHNNKKRSDPVDYNQEFTFQVGGQFDFGRIRLTTADPSKEFFDLVFYPSGSAVVKFKAPDDFPKNQTPVIDIAIYGTFINCEIKNILSHASRFNPPSILAAYKKISPFKDLEFHMAPEPHSLERLSHIYSFIKKIKPKRIIDLSSGAMPILAERIDRELETEIMCTVHSEDELRRARRLLRRCPNIKLHEEPIDLDRAIPSIISNFDLVVISDVLEHLKNPKAVVDQLGKMMKPSSKILITVPSPSFNEVFSKEFADAIGHRIPGLSIEQLKQFAEESCMKLIKVYAFGEATSVFYKKWYSTLKLWNEDYRFSLPAIEMALRFIETNIGSFKCPIPERSGPSLFAILEKV